MADYSSHVEKAPVHLNIVFDSAEEAEQLFRSLHTWTPTNGWSQVAEDFFEALKEASEL